VAIGIGTEEICYNCKEMKKKKKKKKKKWLGEKKNCQVLVLLKSSTGFPITIPSKI
jgi:hypothetical protein